MKKEKNKILALYLPQYHAIPENDMWWGKGYTEWTAVKGAKPLFYGHMQPKVPLNKNYYDLSEQDGKTWKWQAELAKKYNIYGFCIYHYWFDEGKQLLEKPMEILLAHPEIDINYCICWANETWARNWYGQFNSVLMKQEYRGIKEYKAHFDYLLPFFKDKRYIKVDNKPMVNIYRCEDIEDLESFRLLWDDLARQNGFSGIYIVSARTGRKKIEARTHLIDAFYNFEPGYTRNHIETFCDLFLERVWTIFAKGMNKFFKTNIVENKVDARKVYFRMKEQNRQLEKPVYPGVFVKWDNTPRRGKKGIVYFHTAPNLFGEQLKYILQFNNKMCVDNEFIYINAWNEWGEGCYLEPDESDKYSYLEEVKKAFSL